MTSSVVGLRRSSQHFPKPNLQQSSWSLFGGLIPVWSTAAFWIPEKPLHLRSMLSKSMRCTKNCNACSWHWLTERPNSAPWQCLTARCTTNALPVERIGLQSFASSTIFTWPLADWLQLLQASRQLFAGKTSTTSRRQKVLSRNLSNPTAWVFSRYENKETYFSLAKMCWL